MILTTERLRLRWLTNADAPYLQEMDADPEVMRYLGGAVQSTLQDGEAWVFYLRRKYYDAGSRYGVFAAEEKATGEFIGWFILRPALDYRYAVPANFDEDQLELGYRFRQKFWGQGLATEGAIALVEYARVDSAISAVVAIALEANRASTRVMEKAGLTYWDRCHLPGRDAPAVTYRLNFAEK